MSKLVQTSPWLGDRDHCERRITETVEYLWRSWIFTAIRSCVMACDALLRFQKEGDGVADGPGDGLGDGHRRRSFREKAAARPKYSADQAEPR